MSSIRLRWVVARAAGFLLAGCDDGPPADSPAPAASAAKPTKPPASRVPPEMVAAVSSTLNSNFVSVHFVLNGIPTVNKALPVDIAIVPHQAVSALVAHFEARDGLALAAGNALDRQADPAVEKVIKHQLVLLPGKEGVFMLTAVIETETSEETVSRVYSIPVIVAPSGTSPTTEPPAPAPATPAANPPASG